jgi:hypothetical protein
MEQQALVEKWFPQQVCIVKKATAPQTALKELLLL